MARQHGLDQSHMDVKGAREFSTRTAIPPEWAKEAFLQTIAKWWYPYFWTSCSYAAWVSVIPITYRPLVMDEKSGCWTLES